MSTVVETVLDQISKMTVLEVVDLIKSIEDKFGVTAAAPMAMMAAPAAGAGAAEAEQTEFKLMLTKSGESKVGVIKVVRTITGLGLKEAKDLVDGAPGLVKEGLSKADAENFKKQLVEAGAECEIK